LFFDGGVFRVLMGQWNRQRIHSHHEFKMSMFLVWMSSIVMHKFDHGEGIYPVFWIWCTVDGEVCFNVLVEMFCVPSVCGWYERAVWMPNFFISSRNICEANCGPQSERILSGSPNRLKTLSRIIVAVALAVAPVFEQGMRIIPFIRPWSTTERIESRP
jgi:hypothetical protein